MTVEDAEQGAPRRFDIHLLISFPGDDHSGDSIPPDTLDCMARLGFRLGIEVFQVKQNDGRGFGRRLFA